MQAKDAMTTVATIGVDATVKYAAKLIIQRGIGALPVLDGKHRVVGVVSEGDLMRRTGLRATRRALGGSECSRRTTV